jgi:hypothetical protein
MSLLVNGFMLKIYKNPTKKEEFKEKVKTQNMDSIDSRETLSPSKP